MNTLHWEPSVQSDVGRLVRQFNQNLENLADRKASWEEAVAATMRIDGAIVGTGRPDFTTTNAAYEFEHHGERFRLLDVPGIEGDEARYAELIRSALAEAHLVFYVIGTNKKPEAETAAKIARYLRHDTIVHPICNVRGKGDTYEFPEDRVSLAQTHKDMEANARLTEAVLRQCIGDEVVRPTISLQGMAALSAMAWHENGTTFVPERADLVRGQAGLLDAFEDAGALRRFSQIDQLSELLKSYGDGGLQREIAAANRRKVLRHLRDTLQELDEHIRRTVDLERTFGDKVNATTKRIDDALGRFEISLQGCFTAVDSSFEVLNDKVFEIVERDFKSRETVEKAIRKETSTCFDQLQEEIGARNHSALNRFQEDVIDQLERMREDLEALHSASLGGTVSGLGLSIGSVLKTIDFQLDDFGKSLLRVAGYVSTALSITWEGGPVAMAIGAAIGVVVGLAVELLTYFGIMRDKRIRKVQGEVIAKLDEYKEGVRLEVERGVLNQCTTIREIVDAQVVSPLKARVAAIIRAGEILRQHRVRVASLYETIQESLHESV
ncbi:GTPase [Dyella sp.]|uniref:GTPase n=1 Tax=Dyella sp. TaxID=1869338 RepID=UPI002FD8F124